MTASRIPGLDALRGLAAVMVLIFHQGGLTLPRGVLGHGYLAVDLFFVISGFVLARASGADLAAGEGAAFMRRRLKRLYPMVVLGLALGVVYWFSAGNGAGGLSLLLPMGLLFLPYVGLHHLFPLNGPQWSLMLELWVNLLYALVAPWLSTRRLIALVLVAGLGHAALVLLFGTGQVGPNNDNWWAGPPRVIFGFFAGVLLARLADEGRLKVAAAPIGALLAATALLLWAPVPEAARAIFDVGAVLLACPLLVASAAGAVVQGRLRTALDGLAGISYALYALHMPIILIGENLGRGLPEGWARWGVNALAALLALAAAWAAHRWFEPWAAGLLGRGRVQGFSTSAPSSSTR